MDFLLIFEKGFVAAIAALGFAAVGNPSKAALEGLPTAAKPKAAMAAKKPFSRIRRKSIVA